MIPGAETRRRAVVLHRSEPVPAPDHRDRGTFVTPRIEAPETPLDSCATHDEVVRRLSAPMRPQRPDGSFVTPRLYPSALPDPWAPDVASVIAKVSM